MADVIFEIESALAKAEATDLLWQT